MAKFFGITVDTVPNLIVMEYFPKGSLEDLLGNTLFELSFLTKLSLALDIIKGLDYLHKHCKITHGKLRSTNCMVIAHA